MPPEASERLDADLFCESPEPLAEKRGSSLELEKCPLPPTTPSSHRPRPPLRIGGCSGEAAESEPGTPIGLAIDEDAIDTIVKRNLAACDISAQVELCVKEHIATQRAGTSMIEAKLKVKIVGAAGLRDADWAGKSDPYCVCRLPRKPDFNFQTQVASDNVNPEWNEEFVEDFVSGDTLEFAVYDSDTCKMDELLGRVTLKSEVFLQHGFHGALPLSDDGGQGTMNVIIEVMSAAPAKRVPGGEESGPIIAALRAKLADEAQARKDADEKLNAELRKVSEKVMDLCDLFGKHANEAAASAAEVEKQLQAVRASLDHESKEHEHVNQEDVRKNMDAAILRLEGSIAAERDALLKEIAERAALRAEFADEARTRKAAHEKLSAELREISKAMAEGLSQERGPIAGDEASQQVREVKQELEKEAKDLRAELRRALKLLEGQVEQQLKDVRTELDERKKLAETMETILPQPSWVAEQEDAPSPVSLSRSPTSLRPFASSQMLRSGLQDKANWASGSSYAVASVPNHDSSTSLNHGELEHNLVEKVLATQPDRSRLGFDEIIMRDIANSVVRELVGVFDALLDRLLIEKKQDTIRTIVAELVTEDIAAVIATGREQLKQRELGHITREIERLCVTGREREAVWEDRFQITQELRDSQDDLWATLDERCHSIEQRLAEVESLFTPRMELDGRLREILDEMASVRVEGCAAADLVAEMNARLTAQETFSHETFATWEKTATMEEEIYAQIRQCETASERELQLARDSAATKASVTALHQLHDDRVSKMDSNFFEISQQMNIVEVALKKAQRYSDETYVTKAHHDAITGELQQDLQTTVTRMAEENSQLDSAKASRREVDDLRSAASSAQVEAQQSLSKVSTGLDRTLGVLMALEQRVDQTFATQKYVDEVTKNIADEIVERSDAKEEFARLWKEFDAERERLRQTVRQQQTNRKDINDTMENLHDLKLRSDEFGKRCEQLHESIGALDVREEKRWEEGQAALLVQKQAQADLEVSWRVLREEFLSHVDWQRSEGERLKHHSTQRYLEQMDKALNLTNTMEKLTNDNREINATVRSIKLPRV